MNTIVEMVDKLIVKQCTTSVKHRETTKLCYPLPSRAAGARGPEVRLWRRPPSRGLGPEWPPQTSDRRPVITSWGYHGDIRNQ